MKSKIFALTITILLIFSGMLVTAGVEATDGGEDTNSSDEDLEPTAISQEYPNFQVNINSINSPVTVGETFIVNATINNTGRASGTQDINLTIDNVIRDTTTITLDPGTEKYVNLTWDTSEGDEGSYVAEVSSEDDTASLEMAVLKPPYFAIDAVDTNSPVVEGETYTVNATITNTGDETGTQEIELMVGKEIKDNTTLTLDHSEGSDTDYGKTETVTLTWDTEKGDVGDYRVKVSTEDEEEARQLTVVEGPYFEVSIDSTNSPVKEGDDLTVHATINNTGAKTGTQEIELMIEDQTMDTTEVNLDPGEASSLTFTWSTGEGEAGNYTAEISSDDDSNGTSVQVEPKRYTLNITVEGEGTLEVDGVEMTAPHEEMYDNGTTVELDAVSTDGWQFESWKGDRSGTDKELNVTITGDTDITANFTEEETGQNDTRDDDGDGDDDGGGDSPGFTSALLLSAVLLSVVIWYKRKR